MTDGERLKKFDADFDRLKKNREKVPLEQLRTRYADAYNALVAEVQAGADWYAAAYISLLVSHFPRHPKDAAGNEWLDRKIAAIRAEEEKPGGRVERYRAALLERLDLKEYEQLVWEIYNRLEVEAFDPYWQRHNRWIGPPDRRWIYNDITGKYWWPNKEQFPTSGGCWINRDYTGHDTWFPPKIKEDNNG